MCNAVGGNTNIAIGEGTTGITAVVGEGDAPNVTAVGLGNVNGVTLAVGAGAGEATAQKDGNTYKISGNATGIDMANPTSPVTKPFEIEVTCP
jgi:lipoprotein LpqH